MEPLSTGLTIKEALAVLKVALAPLASPAVGLAKTQLQKWKNDGNIRRLATKILEVTKVKTLYGADDAESLYRFYYPSKIKYNEHITKQINSISELGRHSYVIQGTAGQGKSIFLRFLTGQELRELTSSGRIPIFVEMRRVQGGITLYSLIKDSFARLGLEISDTIFQAYADLGRIVLLLDAFDEIEGVQVSETLNYLETLVAKYDRLQIIVSARPDSDIQRSNAFRVVRLAPLTPADHPHFLRKICPDLDQAARLEVAIKQSSVEIRGLLTTPLLLTLLTVIYTAQQSIPDTLPGFYEQLFDVLFFKHDRAKAAFKRKRHTKLDDTAIRKLFEAFCFQVRMEGKSVLNTTLYRECLHRALAICGFEVEDNAFRSEMVKTVCLMQDEGFDLVFVHKSVSEFHAAVFVRHSTDDIAEGYYSTLREQGRWRNWRQELRFLEEIDPVRFARYFAIPELIQIAQKYHIDISRGVSAHGTVRAGDVANMGRY